MTQQEFMERTGITPTAEDFDYIHAVYLNTSMNKDEFCKDFKKHGDSRIIRDVHVRVLNYEMKCERQKEVIDNLKQTRKYTVNQRIYFIIIRYITQTSVVFPL
jgi:hypothetical protein